MNIDETLEERGSRYGSFAEHGLIAQGLKSVVTLSGKTLEPYQREALDMILHKIARIVNGDPNYVDSWHDIAGYATLVEKELNKAVMEKKQ